MNKLHVVAILVGIIVFVVALLVPYFLLSPDPTPRTLAAQAWLTGPPQSSQLLAERNLREQKEKISTVSLADFKAAELTARDVLPLAGGYNSPMTLEYYGQKPDGTFISARVSVADLFPRRSAIYQTDWQTFTFDRQTGKVSVTSQPEHTILLVALLVFALALAASFAVTTPEKPGELVFWLGFLVVGAFHLLAFWVWQWGKAGFAAEPAVWAFFVGVASCWCFTALWYFCLEEAHDFKEALALSLIFLGFGVALEVWETVMLFGVGVGPWDWATLAGLYSLPALLTDLVAYWLFVNNQATQPAPPPTKKEARARMNQHAIMMD